MLTRLEVPADLHRNAPRVVAAGYEHTGEVLIRLAASLSGVPDLRNTDVLDVGCGVRHTMSIINRGIPIKSYTGVEVSEPIVDFLKENVERYDPRFRYFHWNVRNEMYNPEGMDLQTQDALPVQGEFDLMWLFSVFTHLRPDDAETMLRLLRRQIRDSGRLLFSTFIDENLDGFEDRVKEAPLLNAYYGRRFMDSLIVGSGWKIEHFGVRDPNRFIQHYYFCSPA